MVDAVSTPLPCGPPAIQFILSITICFTFNNFLLDLSAASAFIDAYTACAVGCFAAVGANTIAIVDKVSASAAKRHIFFAHTFRLCHNNSLTNQRFKDS